MAVPDCLICSMEETHPDDRIFRDDLWAAEIAPGYEVPGWFFLRARRHTEGLTGLDDREADSLGRHARDLMSAVELATGAPAIYFLHFGESYRHFHALVAARGTDVPDGLKGWRLVQMLPHHVDLGRSRALAGVVRAAYESSVGSGESQESRRGRLTR